jgi:hypothetical protein
MERNHFLYAGRDTDGAGPFRGSESVLPRSQIDDRNLDSWLELADGFTAQPQQYDYPVWYQPGNPDISSMALGDVQTGVNRWISTVVNQDQESPESNFDFNFASQGEDSMFVDGSNDVEAESRICYGMLNQVDVQLISDMNELKAQLDSIDSNPEISTSDFMVCQLKPQGFDSLSIQLPNGSPLGHISDKRSRALRELVSNASFSCEPILLSSKLRLKIGKVTKKSEAKFHVDVNIYGPASQALEIGNQLSNCKAWLQKPDYYKKSFPYENPHKISFPELEGLTAEEV